MDPRPSLSELRSATQRADPLTPVLQLGLSPSSESKSEAVRALHFEPATMRRAECPQEDGRAIVTPQHHSHRSCIEGQSTQGSDGAACVALNMRGRHVSDEDLPKTACGATAITNQIQIALSHLSRP